MQSKIILTVLALGALAKSDDDAIQNYPTDTDIPTTRIIGGEESGLYQIDDDADDDIQDYPIRTDIPSFRIIGGVESKPHSRRYQVGLYIPRSDGIFFCGGSLITNQTVLTAAHCFEDINGDVEVILGAHKIDESESTQVRLKTNDILVHPNYDSIYIRNDIALVKLPEPIELNDHIQVIKLPSDTTSKYRGKKGIVSGWGKYSFASKKPSPVLRELKVTVISNFICKALFHLYITDNTICTSGVFAKGACLGDSGGALVIDDVQVGIVSFVHRISCYLSLPTGYTRVTSYLEWINNNLM